MIHILGEVNIGDLQQFLDVFATRGAAMRATHGGQGSQVFAVEGDPDRVLVLLAWESREAFERFQGDPAVRETMASGGALGRPAFTFLRRVGEYPS
jgi:heme-degrading monooxygenase HmoA